MDPQIRFCSAADGTSIAWWAMGAGPSIVLTPPGPVGHIAGELRVGDMLAFYQRMARSFTVVRYDPRRSGSSQREGVTEDHAGRALDIEAAIRTQSTPVALYAGLTWVPAAIEVAAAQPELISRLILWDGFARGEDYAPSSRLLATRAMIEKDWRAYTDAWAQSGFGWHRAESAREWARWYREATTPEDTLARLAQLSRGDVSALLKDVRAPTLVVGHQLGGFTHPDAAKRVAAGIPNARLVMLGGPQLTPAMDAERVEEHVRLIEEFCGVSPSPVSPVASAGRPHSGETAVIFFANIADSTALTERLGDTEFRARARALDDAMRAVVRKWNGALVEAKTLGDGILATFPAASQAIAAALECGSAADRHAMPIHLGLHAGDVIREDENIFGGAVNIAARISALSAPGELLVSGTVAELARTSAGVGFEDRGEQNLKGVAQAVRLYAVRPPSSAG